MSEHPIRQRSANGQPKPTTSIERVCHTCRASFIGLAPGKTGEHGVWHSWVWYCSLECTPADVRAAVKVEAAADASLAPALGAKEEER